jgi:hypothetical protein
MRLDLSELRGILAALFAELLLPDVDLLKQPHRVSLRGF